MTGAFWYPLAAVRGPSTPLRLNVSPGLTRVPSSVRAAIVMLVVRGGLTGNWVLKVETSCVTPHPRAVALETFGCVRTGLTVAVRPGEVSAGSTAAATARASY